MGLRSWIYKKTGIKLKKNLSQIDISSQIKNSIEKDGYVIYGDVFIAQDVIIGNYTYFNSGSSIFPNTVIGRYCSIANDVIIAPPEHQKNWLSTHPFQNSDSWGKAFGINIIEHSHTNKKTIIKNDVWIGIKSIIKSGVIIGNGAIIGAGSVVTKDVPDYAIVAGVPAKIIGYRFESNTIQKLLNLKWWNLQIKDLNNVTFNNIDDAISQICKIKIT